MTSRGLGRIGRATVAMATIGVAAACTGSEDLPSSIGNVTLQIETTGSAGRWDVVEWAINNFVVRPVDPLVQEALGGQTLAFGASRFDLDLANAPHAVTAINLSAGTYEVVSIALQNLWLQDAEGAAPILGCSPSRPKSSIPMGDILLWDSFPASSQFTITPGGTHVLAVRVNLDEFVRRAEQFFYLCTSGTCFSQDPPRLVGDPPTQSFNSCVDALQFRQNLVPDVLTIEQIR